MELIKATNLQKKFGNLVAVDGVDISVFGGQIFGFLGPNGAGKTTTIKMLTGVLLPDAGSIEIIGLNYKSNEIEIKKNIGVVPDEPPVFKHLKGKEFLQFIASIYGCVAESFNRIAELVELFQINFLEDYIENYSHGMRQKLMVLSVLMRKPKVLFLDEPTTGLDPYSARALKLILQRFAQEGSAIFFTTHILEIAEKVCDRLGLIVDGKVVATGNMDELRQQAGSSGDLEEIFLHLTGADEKQIMALLEEL